jgi:PD-(D/E)XK endonuclease
MSCASFSSARPAIRRACSSEVRSSFVLCCSWEIVARSAGGSNGHGSAGAIGRLSCMTTDQKGAIAEAAVALAAIRLNIQVYRPIAEGGRCDLVLGVGHGLLRIQCKWSSLVSNVVVVRCSTFRRTREGYKVTTYSEADVDGIAAYCDELDRCFLIPIKRVVGHRTLALRVSPTQNNQAEGINWADDFDFAATLRRHQGAVAQLGERESGTLEVTGSSPVGSIF